MIDQTHVIDFFTKGCEQHGKVDWAAAYHADEFSQHGSHLVLNQVGVLRNASLLDVGCGQGRFYRFLREQGIVCDYTGIDITPQMIELGRESLPRAKLLVGDFLEMEGEKEFDYVLAAGAFNVRVADQKALICRAIDRMFALCRKAIGFTLLSAYGYEKAKEYKILHPYEPSEILSHCLRLTPAVILNHASLPFEFATFAYRLDS